MSIAKAVEVPIAKLTKAPVLVTIQFSFSNPNIVPVSVKSLPRESVAESGERKARGTGKLVIEPTPRTSVLGLIVDLQKEGYVLVDALYQPRVDQHDAKRTYYMVRFLFAREDSAQEPFESFAEVRLQVLDDLADVAGAAMWRVRVFDNPYFRNGVEIAGERTVSVNLEVREPFLQTNGQPVVEWQKDENERRVGEAPVPIKPKHQLRFDSESGKVVLRPVA